jgi:hypothetical protein
MRKATEVRELIEDLTGKACPCDRGLICPLLPLVKDNRSHPVPVTLRLKPRTPVGESGEVRKIA